MQLLNPQSPTSTVASFLTKPLGAKASHPEGRSNLCALKTSHWEGVKICEAATAMTRHPRAPGILGRQCITSARGRQTEPLLRQKFFLASVSPSPMNQ